jgi:hypothetical protein
MKCFELCDSAINLQKEQANLIAKMPKNYEFNKFIKPTVPVNVGW